ncbi:MAG: PadR family transcriptional regulator [Vicinamibacterales bacterium]
MTDRLLREILLAFWKVHILHHAQERPIYGQWILEELRRHGFEVSPGTLYPLLNRLAEQGWLRQITTADNKRSPKARRNYVLTPKGASRLAALRRQVDELHREVMRGTQTRGR